MPVMKITVTFTVPDAGLKVLKRCASMLERPLRGFLKDLVQRQRRWAPPEVHVGSMDLAVEIEATESERTGQELERSRIRRTAELLGRLRDRNLAPAQVTPLDRMAA